MRNLAPSLPLGALSGDDLRYIRASYVPLSLVCQLHSVDERWAREQIQLGRLPLPSYHLEDDAPMFPRDFFALFESSGRSVDAVPGHFSSRYVAAASLVAEPSRAVIETEWQAYLDGIYGVCLWQATPENIFLKDHLVMAVDRALAAPQDATPTWRRQLRRDIAALDALSRPFTRCDQVRFGKASSRERLIVEPRRRYEWLGQPE